MLKFRVLLFVIAGRTETAVGLAVCTVWGRGSALSSAALLTGDCFVIFKIFVKRCPTKCLNPLIPGMFVNNQILSYNKSQPDALFLNFIW
jgi:hypothetical protein